MKSLLKRDFPTDREKKGSAVLLVIPNVERETTNQPTDLSAMLFNADGGEGYPKAAGEEIQVEVGQKKEASTNAAVS